MYQTEIRKFPARTGRARLRPSRGLPTAQALFVAAVAALSGCTENAPNVQRPTPPPLTTEPIGVQMARVQPRLKGLPFRVLLDFERPTDLAFLSPGAPSPTISSDQSHTGQSSLKIAPGRFEVKLASLLPSGGSFPGNWTLAGAYFHADGPAPSTEQSPPATVTVAYRLPSSLQPLLQRTVPLLPGNAWTGVFLDLTQLPTVPHNNSAEVGLLTFQVDAAQPVCCDDVLLMNNSRTIEEPPAGAPAESGWTIRENGLAIVVDRPSHFRAKIDTPEANPRGGWTVEESSDLRVRFVSSAGETWTLYNDGRQYIGGKCDPLKSVGDAAAAMYVRAHDAPAEMIVADEFGRIDRDTPGDRNNDGYNETRGAYQLIARGGRFQVTLKPAAAALARPVLEIAGLPAGNPMITVEGQWVEKSTRLSNGNLLIDLPLLVERPITINVHIR